MGNNKEFSAKETKEDDRYWSVDQVTLGLVLLQAGKLGYKFRPIDRYDQGVDGELQLELAEVPAGLSRHIGIQIKGRSACRINKDHTVSITVEESNLLYWKRFGRPVVLICGLDPLNSSQPQLYWTRVDNLSTRTIRVSLDQKFDESTKQAFLQILSEYYNINNLSASISLNVPIKDISEVLANFVSTVGEVIQPIENKLSEAEAYISQENYEVPSRLYEALATIFDNVFLFWYNWVSCLLGQRKFHETLPIAYQVVEQWPEKWEAHFLLGSCLGLAGKLEEAVEHLQKTLELRPSESLVWSNLGLTYYWLEDYESALQANVFAIQYNEDNYAALFNSALCLTLVGRYEDALFFYDMCIKANPQLFDAYNNKGMLLKCLGRIWEALGAFDAAMEVDPTSALAFHNSAFLLKDLGYNERAIQLYHMAEEKGMVNQEVYSSLALLYCRVGNWDKARLYWRRFYTCLVNDEKPNLSKGAFVVFDLGYEVVGTVKIDFASERINIISVNFRTENTFFDLPDMRFLLKYAHILNIPFLIRDPRQEFKPDLIKDKQMLNLRRIDINAVINEK